MKILVSRFLQSVFELFVSRVTRGVRLRSQHILCKTVSMRVHRGRISVHRQCTTFCACFIAGMNFKGAVLVMPEWKHRRVCVWCQKFSDTTAHTSDLFFRKFSTVDRNCGWIHNNNYGGHDFRMRTKATNHMVLQKERLCFGVRRQRVHYAWDGHYVSSCSGEF